NMRHLLAYGPVDARPMLHLVGSEFEAKQDKRFVRTDRLARVPEIIAEGDGLSEPVAIVADGAVEPLVEEAEALASRRDRRHQRESVVVRAGPVDMEMRLPAFTAHDQEPRVKPRLVLKIEI